MYFMVVAIGLLKCLVTISVTINYHVDNGIILMYLSIYSLLVWSMLHGNISTSYGWVYSFIIIFALLCCLMGMAHRGIYHMGFGAFWFTCRIFFCCIIQWYFTEFQTHQSSQSDSRDMIILTLSSGNNSLLFDVFVRPANVNFLVCMDCMLVTFGGDMMMLELLCIFFSHDFLTMF